LRFRAGDKVQVISGTVHQDQFLGRSGVVCNVCQYGYWVEFPMPGGGLMSTGFYEGDLADLEGVVRWQEVGF
jgi:hypothetical protein